MKNQFGDIQINPYKNIKASKIIFSFEADFLYFVLLSHKNLHIR